MKSHILFFRIACVSVNLIVANGCMASTVQEAMREGALAKLNYHVVTSEGMPVSNAFIEVGFYQNKKPGKNPSVKGLTDEKGCFTASKKCMYDVGFVVQKDGFYRSKGHINLTESDVIPLVKDGKWQPYGRNVKIELRERKNPIAVDVIGFDAEIPKLNELIGYDIKVGDFLPPYGAGVVADFYLMYSYKIWPMRHSDACIKLVFPNALDGAYRKKKDVSFSDMRMDYHANTNVVYSKEIVLERKYENGDIEKKISTELKNNEYLVLRTRTKVNNKGELLEANYGMIIGEFKMWTSPPRIIFSSFINPNVNDTNLEYDRQGNPYKKIYK